MPAAQTKAELVAVTENEYQKLIGLLDQIDCELVLEKDEEDISIKDIVVHRAHWIDLFLGWYRDGQTGDAVHFPAPGYKWNDLKAYNSELRTQTRLVTWPEAREQLSDAYARLQAFLGGQSNEALYAAPMKGARNDWTTGRWAEAAGASHFRSASKYIRARIRAAR